MVINTGENMVCVLTGLCVMDNVQELGGYMIQTYNAREKGYDPNVYEGIIESIKEDIIKFFSSDYANNLEINDVIMEEGHLKSNITQLISQTFKFCFHLFEETNCGYDLICSMYIHIIISIYSKKTVYGHVLFKCTKNKKYDAILKTMREVWMSTLITIDSPLKNVM